MNASERRVEVSHIMGTAVSPHVIGRGDDHAIDRGGRRRLRLSREAPSRA
jgi:hypothetical protein